MYKANILDDSKNYAYTESLFDAKKDNETVKAILRGKIVNSLVQQGFHLETLLNDKNIEYAKAHYKKLQVSSAIAQRIDKKESIIKLIPVVKKYLRNGHEIDPDKIKLELIEVTSNSVYEKIYRWWNIVWWSMPYQRPYGRQMRFLLWDTYHNAPFGLIGLQSPVLKMSPRDKYYNIPNDEIDFWINQSMNAQRLGALPPYNDLIGGKMVALSLVAKEIREAYRRKYIGQITLLADRVIDPELLFVTTSSAFGKSSIYNRLKMDGKMVAKSIGYTKGYGSFHISENLFLDILAFLEQNGVDIKRSFGSGPSRRIKLLSQAFSLLDLHGLTKHGLKRELFIFENATNINDVIHNGAAPKYHEYDIESLFEYWKHRWALPRANTMQKWKSFDVDLFLAQTVESLEN